MEESDWLRHSKKFYSSASFDFVKQVPKTGYYDYISDMQEEKAVYRSFEVQEAKIPELSAMAAIAKVMKIYLADDPSARERVANWIVEKYKLKAPTPPAS